MNVKPGIFTILFGARENAPTNIVGAIILLSAILLSVLLILSAFGFVPINDAEVILACLITGALGYMFGKN